MANFRLQTWLNEAPSTATVTLDGVEIFSGEVGVGQPIEETITLSEFTSTGGEMSVTVNSGYLKVGIVQVQSTYPVWNNSTGWWAGAIVQTGAGPDIYEAKLEVPANVAITDTNYWASLGTGNVNYWTNDCRSNILINGSAPTWPATPPEPGGTPENPNWAGWFFDTSAGSTVTFTITP